MQSHGIAPSSARQDRDAHAEGMKRQRPDRGEMFPSTACGRKNCGRDEQERQSWELVLFPACDVNVIDGPGQAEIVLVPACKVKSSPRSEERHVGKQCRSR